jgi:hypothetical protein
MCKLFENKRKKRFTRQKEINNQKEQEQMTKEKQNIDNVVKRAPRGTVGPPLPAVRYIYISDQARPPPIG